MSGHRYPRIAYVGVHVEAEAPLRFLLESGENVVGLVTLTAEAAAKVSGAVMLEPLCRQFGVPVLQAADINSGACREWLRSIEPDILLVVGWTQLLKEPLLQLPKVAALGFHASLLPKYRGRAPVNWAIIHGETETGNTLMVLEAGADEGDIVAQHRIVISERDTCATIYQEVSRTEIAMLGEVLPAIRAGALPRRRQESALATVMPKRRPEDGWIDWRKSAVELHNWVRALTHPYPGAFTALAADDASQATLWVWKAEVAEDAGVSGAPAGLVRRDRNGWPVAATGNGWLRLLSVQKENEVEVPGNRALEKMILTEGSVLARKVEDAA